MLYAMFAMVVLTLTLGLIALKTRIASVRNGQLPARYFKLMQGAEAPELVVKTSRCFNNQFEVPVLFYTAGAVGLGLGLNHWLPPTLAWLFVASRLLQAGIHLTYNHVIHRLAAFALGNACVLALWVAILWLC